MELLLIFTYPWGLHRYRGKRGCILVCLQTSCTVVPWQTAGGRVMLSSDELLLTSDPCRETSLICRQATCTGIPCSYQTTGHRSAFKLKRKRVPFAHPEDRISVGSLTLIITSTMHSFTWAILSAEGRCVSLSVHVDIKGRIADAE